MNQKEQEAEIEYARLLKDDEGKTYLDILPAEFKSFKRSIIKRNILFHIKSTTKFLNNCSIYEGQKFTELQVTRFMMARSVNYSLARKYVPIKSSFELRFIHKNFNELSNLQREELRKPFEELEHHIQWLKQSWEAWESRQNIKKHGVDDVEISFEESGAPRTGRGYMCSVYTAVKGEWLKNQTGELKLFNPRSRKNVTLTIEKYCKNEDVYITTDSKGKKVYLTTHESVADSWDALFQINKEIYSGWWNKILIWK